MENSFTKNSLLAGIIAAVAICGAFVALADNPSTQPVEPNQCEKGKAGMGSSTTMPASAPLFDPVSEFRRAFKSAATATERRDLVMKACDDHLIKRYMTLNDLKTLFGDYPMFVLSSYDNEKDEQTAALYFKAPQPVATEPSKYVANQTESGWHIHFQLQHNLVASYCLSNVMK